MKFVATITLALLTTYLFNSSLSRSHIEIKNSASDTTIIADEGYRTVITNYENGKKNGKEVIVFKNGDTSKIWTFKNDSLEGQEVSFYAHNKVCQKGNYKTNLRTGIWQEFDTLGNLITEVSYNGKDLWPEKETFYRDNQIIFTQIWGNGRRTKIIIHDQRLYNEYELTDSSLGHKIFNETCATCHSLKGKIIGPALFDVTQIRQREWLVEFIRDAREMRKNNDSLSNTIYVQYEKMEHPNYSYLTRGDIEAVLDYIHTKK